MIVFSEKNVIKTTLAELKGRGFVCINMNTVIEGYKKGQEIIYYHGNKDVFFKNGGFPVPSESPEGFVHMPVWKLWTGQ